MNVDALPKILFQHEESEQMHDRRIRSKVQYDTSGDNPIKIITKKINNTIQLTENLHPNNQINSLAYSNKHGVMITCLDQEILLTGFQKLQTYFATPDTNKKSLKTISTSLKFSGKVYLSPDDSKFLAVNKEELMLFDIPSLSILFSEKNQHSLRHFIFVNNDVFVGWNFLSQAFVYQNIQSGLNQRKKLQEIEKCTSINSINNHILAFQKINPGEDDEDTKVIVYNSTGSEIKNEISLRQFENPDMYMFNFAQIISIFVIKQEKQGQFSKNDTYGLVMGYYDDFEQEPDRRYLNFLQGDLLNKNSNIKIRGFQLFLSPTEDRSFYYDQNGQKIPFQVQIITTGQIKIIMIEKLEIVNVVDCSLQFQKLNMYTLQPSHQIKLQDHKYFKGICLMKNMLDAQRRPPVGNSNEICDMICKQFNGQFLSLYFASKETELTVPFPATVVVLGDGKIMRRYAIETTQSVDENEVEKLREAIKKIKKSNYVEKIQNPVKIQGGKQLTVASGGKIPQKIQQVKKEEKPIAGLFGQPSNLVGKGASLFGQQNKAQSTSLFGQKQTTPTGSLFGQKSGPSLFGNNTQLTQQKGGFSLFAQQQPPSDKADLFAAKKEQEPKKSSSLFSNTGPQQQPQSNLSSLFGNMSTGNKQQATPFQFGKGQSDKKPILFGSVDQNKGPLFSNEIKKEQQNKQINEVPNVFGKVTNKQKQQKTLKQAAIKQVQKKQQVKPETQLSNQQLLSKKVEQKQVPQKQEKTQNVTSPQGGKLSFGSISAANMFKAKSTQAMPPTNVPAVSQTIPKVDEKLPFQPKIEQKGKQQTKTQEQLSTSKQQTQAKKQQKPKPVLQLRSPVESAIYPTEKKTIEPKQKKQEQRISQKVELQQPQRKQQKKSLTIQKLQQIATSMGFISIELIPQPLRQLTPQQADALITSLQNMTKPKQSEPKKLSPQEQARENLLRKQYFSKILSQMDENKKYLRRVKQANNIITSSKIFSLRGVKQMLQKEKTVLKQKSAFELKSKNQLVNVVKEYIKKMQLFGRYEMQIGQFRSNEAQLNKQNKQYFEQRLQRLQEDVTKLTYFKQVLYPQRNSFWGLVKQNNFMDDEDRWVEVQKKKNNTIDQLIEKANKLLQETQKHQVSLAPRVYAVNTNLNIDDNKTLSKSPSVATNMSSRQLPNKKRKGHFAFNMDSNSSENASSEDQSLSAEKKVNHYQPKAKPIINGAKTSTNRQTYMNNNQSDYFDSSKLRLLIKVKPESVVLSPDVLTPLIVLPSTSTGLLYTPEEFNPIQLFKQTSQQQQSTQLLKSSVKKPVNFNERIPLKKDDLQSNIMINQIKATRTIKFEQSSQGSLKQLNDGFIDHNQSENQADDVPQIGRTLSKFVSKDAQITRKKQTIKQSQKNEPPVIKKTFEKQVVLQKVAIKQTVNVMPNEKTVTVTKTKQDQKKDLTQQTKQAASIFGQSKNIDANKNQQTTPILFGNAGKAKVESQSSKLDNKGQLQGAEKKGPTINAPISLLGAASGAATLFAKKQSVPQKQVQKQKTTETTPQSVGGLFAANKPSQGSKAQQKSKQSTQKPSLFENKPSLFENKPSLFENKPPVTAIKKEQEQKKVNKQQQSSKQGEKSLFGGVTKASQQPTTGLFGSSTNAPLTLFGNPTELLKVQQKQQSTQSDIKKAQKAAGQSVNKQEKKQVKQPTSLFGGLTENKGSLFGNTSPLSGGTSLGLLQNKEVKQTKQKKQEIKSKPQVQQQKSTGLFGNLTTEKKTEGGLFGGVTNSVKNPAGQQLNINKNQQQVKNTTLPTISKNESNQNTSLTQNTTGQSLFNNTNITPQQTQQNQQQQPSLFNQQQNTKPAFGAQNRFLASGQQQQPTQQQNTGFNPNAATFTANTGSFGSTANTGGFKSFANFGQNKQNTSLFGQQQQQPPTGGLFGQNAQQNSLFGNQPQQTGGLFTNQQQPTTGIFGQQSTTSLFGQQSGSGMFGQQQATTGFGQSGQGGNFLAGFNPSGGLGAPTNAPTSNPTLLKPRK